MIKNKKIAKKGKKRWQRGIQTEEIQKNLQTEAQNENLQAKVKKYLDAKKKKTNLYLNWKPHLMKKLSKQLIKIVS